MCADAQTASVARIKAERSRKLARGTLLAIDVDRADRLIALQQRDSEHGPKAGKAK
jgi:hypothetical protein